MVYVGIINGLVFFNRASATAPNGIYLVAEYRMELINVADYELRARLSNPANTKLVES